MARLADPERRRLDPDRTRLDILEVAHAEFAEHGLSGARVDAIAARTQTTKRMIYYYFGSKERLYLAVLERAYTHIRALEAELALDELAPEDAIRRMIEFTFDYQEANPDFIRLVSIENIHYARFLKQSDTIRAVNAAIVDTLAGVLARGRTSGVFRADVAPVDVHMLISAFCFFRVSNRHTFGTLFEMDLSESSRKRAHKTLITEAVLGLLRTRQEAEASGPRKAA